MDRFFCGSVAKGVGDTVDNVFSLLSQIIWSIHFNYDSEVLKPRCSLSKHIKYVLNQWF